MKRAYFNCILLDGHRTDGAGGAQDGAGGRGEDHRHRGETAPEGYEKVDLKSGYLMPGLINLHVHLAGNGRSPAQSPGITPHWCAGAIVNKLLQTSLKQANSRVKELVKLWLFLMQIS